MTGPGGPEVGRVSVRVVPDTSKFADDLRRKLQRIEKSEKLHIPVQFDADREQLQSELEKLRVRAVQVPVEPDFTNFTRELNDRIRAIKPTPVKVPLEPDFTGFRQKLNAQLRAIQPPNIKVGAEPDLTGFRTSLNTQLRAARPTPVKVGATPDLTGFRSALRAALATVNTPVRVPLEIRGLAEIAKLRATLDAIGSKNVAISINVKGLPGAIAQLEYLFSLVSLLDGRRINITVDVDGAGAAAALGAANLAASGLTNTLGNLGKRGAGGGVGSILGVTRAAGTLLGVLLQAGAVSLALAVAGAAVTAAWGAVSAAIVAIPGAISLLAAPIAAVAIGMDGIKAAAKTIKPEFDKMQKAVSDTFEKHMIPVFKTLTGIFPTLTTGLQASARAVSFLAQSMANMLASQPGLALLRQTFTNINFALTQMHPGIESVVQGLLLLGSQTSVFDALVKAVNTFGEEFRNSVIDMITDGSLKGAMDGLGESLAALSRGFFDLVHNGLRVFANAAPGVNQFIDDLTGFFNRFDWDALGKSVGDVFSGLGDVLRDVDPGTIKGIEDAFKRLGDLFKDPKFQADLGEIVKGLPAAIDQLRVFAQDFAGIAADLSDALTKFNTFDQKFREATDGILKQIEKLGRDANISGENGAFGWLKKMEDDIEGFFDNPPDTEEWRKALERAFEKPIEPQFGSVKTPEFKDIFDFDLDDLFGGDELDLDDLLDLEIPDFEQLTKDALEGIEKAIDDKGPDINTALSNTMSGLGNIVTAGMLVIQTAIQSGTTGWALAVGVGMQQVMLRLTSSFAQMGTIATQGMIRVQTAMTQGTIGWANAVTLAMQAVQLALQTAFTQLSTIATQGMVDVQAAMAAGMLNWALEVQLAMQRMLLALQTGLQQLAAAVSLGMLTITNTFTLGAAQWELAFVLALQRIQTAVQAALATILVIVTTGMDAILVVIQTRLALILQLVNNTLLAIVTAVTNAMLALITVVTSGLTLLLNLFTTILTQIQTLFDGFWALLGAAWQLGMDLLLSIVQTGMQGILDYFSSSIAEMERLATGLWDFLVSAAQTAWQLMTEAATSGAAAMTAAITSGMSASVAAVQSGVATMVSTLNAAVPQFRAAGANMGQALADGLNSKVGAVQAAAARLAAAAATATRAAASIASPSRVFTEIGEMMGQGLANGMDNMQSAVSSAADRLTEAATPDGLTGIGAQWAAEFEPVANDVQRQLRSAGQMGVRLLGSGNGVEIVQNFNVPSAEQASDKALHGMRRLAAMGMFA